MDTIDVTTRYSALNISTNAHTNKDTTIQLANAYVESVNILWMPGHALLTGVQIKYAGNVLLPWDAVGSSLFGDNERREFAIGMYLPGIITVHTSNGDNLAHGHIVEFKWHTYVAPVVGVGAQPTLIVA